MTEEQRLARNRLTRLERYVLAIAAGQVAALDTEIQAKRIVKLADDLLSVIEKMEKDL